MQRRKFLDLCARASALVLAGRLPLLAVPAAASQGGQRERNIFAEPPAIEPITRYLQEFKPVMQGSMASGAFVAAYRLVLWGAIDGETGLPANHLAGDLTIGRRPQADGARYVCRDQRRDPSGTEIKAELTCIGERDELVEWRITSEFLKTRDPAAIRFTEQGRYQGGALIQDTGLAQVQRETEGPLIAQWSLLHLLARGIPRPEPLRFDMLQDASVLKPGQVLAYTGEVEVPGAGSKIVLDCYAQTGYGSLPTHYLVDGNGRVQLITQEYVNWALQAVG